MAWTAAARGDHARPRGSYASDVTERDWALIAPLLSVARRGGRRRSTRLRQMVSAIFHLLQAGCRWRMLPRNFPPRSTVYGYFRAWIAGGVRADVHDGLHRRTRDLEGRDESPTAAIIDNQSVKIGAEAREMVGFDAAKRVKGRKRHLVADTLGLMLRVEIHSVGMQGRDGAALVLKRIARRFPFLERIFADAGDQDPRIAAAAPRPVGIVKRTDPGVVVQPKRWGIAHLRLGLHQPPPCPRLRGRRGDCSRPVPDRHDQAHDPQDRALQGLSSQALSPKRRPGAFSGPAGPGPGPGRRGGRGSARRPRTGPRRRFPARRGPGRRSRRSAG